MRHRTWTRSGIRRAATAARFVPGGASWTAIFDVAACSADVLRVEVRAQHLPVAIGAVLWRPPYAPPVLVVNARHRPTRRNFSVAHELGHWLLSHQTPSTPTEARRAEWEANCFAEEFLLPDALLRANRSYPRQSLSALAARLRVSKTCLERRLQGWAFT